MGLGVEKALEVINQYQTTNPYTICYEEKIAVVECDLNRLYGFICRHKNGDEVNIVLNQNLTQVQKLLVLSHELGHYYCHALSVGREFIEKYTNDVLDKFEGQANEFAFTLLGLPLTDMDDTIKSFGISPEQ